MPNLPSKQLKTILLALSLTLGINTSALAKGAGQEWEKIQNEIDKLNKPSDMEQAITISAKTMRDLIEE